MKQLRQIFKRWIALGVCLCFTATLFPEAHAALPSIEISAKAETPRILNIDIPTELASVDEWYQAPAKAKPKLIVHIQDAHANYEAQTKIRDVIKYLNTNYGFKTILVEGAASELDPNILKLFPDQERNVKLADELAKMGEVTGAEMFLVENSDVAKGVGIEKPDLYRRNFDALQKVYSEDEFVSGFFEAYENKLGQISSRSFGPRMIQALAEWRKFESGHREFLPFISNLAELSKKVLDVDLGVLYSQIEWPQLTRLLVLQKIEKELSAKQVAATIDRSLQTKDSESTSLGAPASGLTLKEQAEFEKKQIIDLLKTAKVSDALIQALERFDEKTANLNRIGSSEVRQASAPRALMETLVEEGGKVGFDIREYPAFAKYAGYLILRGEITPADLFEEIKKLFDLVLESLVKDAPSAAVESSDDLAARKRLLLLHRDEMLARKLLKLELSHDEWLAVLKRQDRFYPDDLNRRMLEQLGQNTRVKEVGAEEAAQMKKLNEAFRAAFTFYSAAVNRDTYFFQRTQEVLAQTDKAILITGGFHAEGMKYLFRKYDINYGTLTPRITQEFSNEQYRKVMMTGVTEEQLGSSLVVPGLVNKNNKENYLGAAGLLDPARANLEGKDRSQIRWLQRVIEIAESLGFKVPLSEFGKSAERPSEQAWLDIISRFEIKLFRPSFFSRWVKFLGVFLAFGFISLSSLFAQEEAAAAYLKDAVSGEVQMILASNDIQTWEAVADYLRQSGFKGVLDAKKTGEVMNRLFNQAIRDLKLEGQPLDRSTMNLIARHMLDLALKDVGDKDSGGMEQDNQGVAQDFLAALIASQFNVRSLIDISNDELSRLAQSYGVLGAEIKSAIEVLQLSSGEALLNRVKNFVLSRLRQINDLDQEQARTAFLRDVLDPALFLMERRGADVFSGMDLDAISEAYARLFNGNAEQVKRLFIAFDEGKFDSQDGAIINENLKPFGYQLQFSFDGTIVYKIVATRSVNTGGVADVLLIDGLSRDLMPGAHGLSVVRGSDVYILSDSFDSDSGELVLSFGGKRTIQRLLDIDPQKFQESVSRLRERDFKNIDVSQAKQKKQSVTAIHEMAHKNTEAEGAAIGQLSLLLEADAYIKAVGYGSAPSFALSQWMIYLLNAYPSAQPGSEVADYLEDEIKAAWALTAVFEEIKNLDDLQNKVREFAEKRHGKLVLTVSGAGGKKFPGLSPFEELSRAYFNSQWRSRSEARVELPIEVPTNNIVAEILRTADGKRAVVWSGIVVAALMAYLWVASAFAFLAIAIVAVGLVNSGHYFFKARYSISNDSKAGDFELERGTDAPNQAEKVALEEVEVEDAVSKVEGQITFDSLRMALEEAKARRNVADWFESVFQMANIAVDAAQVEFARSEIRNLRSETRGKLSEAQTTSLIMKVAQLSVKLNQLQQTQKLDAQAEVVVTAKVSIEAAFASLSSEEREILKQMTFDDLENQVKASQDLSPSQAVAVLITFGIIAENDRNAAKNMAKLASLAVAKVTPQRTSELSEMLSAFYPEAFNDDEAELVYVINSETWTDDQAELAKLYLILNPKLNLTVVLTDGQILLDKFKNLIGKEFEKRFAVTAVPAKSISSSINRILQQRSDTVVVSASQNLKGLGQNNLLRGSFVQVDDSGFQFAHRAATLKSLIQFSQVKDQVPDGMEKNGNSYRINKGTLAKLIENIQQDILGMFKVMQSA